MIVIMRLQTLKPSFISYSYVLSPSLKVIYLKATSMIYLQARCPESFKVEYEVIIMDIFYFFAISFSADEIIYKRCKNIIKMSNSFTPFNTQLTSYSGVVNIYVRNYKKHAIILPINTPTTGLQLHQHIKNKYLSQISDFVLCFKGKTIDANEIELNLEPKSIIHLVDISRIKLPTINLIFKTHSKPQQIMSIQVTPQKQIRDVLRQYIRPVIGKGQTEVFLVHLGKPINIFKNFQEQLVEDGSQILVVDFKKKKQPPRERGNQIKMSGGQSIQLSSTQGMEKGILHQTVKVYSPAMGQRGQLDYSINQIKKKASIAHKANFDGFNPHPIAAPAAPPSSSIFQQIQHDGNLQEKKTAPPQNPQKGGGPTIKVGDSIFSGQQNLFQTENLLSEAAKEIKASLKEAKGAKKSSSKEN